MKRRVSKKNLEAMRRELNKKKKYIREHFCIAYLHLVSTELYAKCTISYKPKESCGGCICNKKKRREIHD